jgi:putative oligomerization/nucleic acid binding protein
MMRRRGPGLVGVMARTAVIAGTATAVSGAVAGHQQKKAMAQEAEVATQYQTQEQQAQIEDMQAQMAAMQQQQVAAAVPAAAPAAAPANDLVGQLNQLQSLRTAGVLNDAEFEAAKAKLLAG